MLEKDNKNEMIGIFLMVAILFGYNYFVSSDTPPQAVPKKVDSTAIVKEAVKLPVVLAMQADSSVKARNFVIENDDIKVSFNTQGAAISKVELKNYKTFDAKPLVLLDEQSNTFNAILPSSQGKTETQSLVYSSENQSVKVSGKDSVLVNFQTVLKTGETITNQYVIKGKGFDVPFSIKLNGAKVLAATDNMNIVWSNKIKQTENDISVNRKEAKINYYNAVDDENNDFLAQSNDSKDLVEPIKWLSFKQLYFNTGLINESTNFSSTKLVSETNELDSSYVKRFTATSTMPADVLNKGAKFKFYFGPNDISILKPVTDVYRNNVYLGYDLVKPVNRYLFVPMFNFYESYIKNYGLLIILVVLTLKILLTPLVYKSYTSMAKMRVLAPEIEEIKKKAGDDQAKVQQEQMKLYQQVGVSPMAGCVPALLQMPILMSVFFLFPNMIMFRQQPFLWAKDLSTYDAPISWATNIPIIGNHISLFAVFYLISTLAYTYYNNQTTPAQPGPIDMKKLSYLFPVVFFFVLNSFSAALNFYYFVSNLVTIIQQLIIRKFVDEGKIRAVLLENQSKFQANPTAVKKSKFSKFLEESMKAAEETKRKQEAEKKKKK
jgi:YidC/Oxa1 family membrane protein insertase